MSLQDTILNSLHRAVIVTGIDGKITYWNRMAERLYGWSAAEAIGKRIVDVRPTDMTEAQAEEVKERLHAGRSWEGIVRVWRKDGSGFNAFVADSPILDDNGDFTGIVGVSREVTEPLDDQQLLNTVLRKSLLPTAVCLSDGTFISFNTALEELIGYKQSEIADVNDWAEKLYPDPDYRSFVMKNIGQALQGEEQECSVFEITRKDGQKKTLEFHISCFHGGLIVQMVDMTERERIASEREATIRLLGMINAENSLHELMKLITEYMHDWSGCEAVGIRLPDGKDFPYYETRGFPKDFVFGESSLCAVDTNGEILTDTAGNPVLECMCGNVIKGRVDPALPFFTDKGSFWTNSTSDLLASTSKEDRQARTRNRCNGEGYESVALIPLRTGKETLGLMQFNDRRKGTFTPAMIHMLERLAENLALGLSQRLAARALYDSEKKMRSILEASTSLIHLVDRNGIVLDCNAQLPIRFGTTRDNIIGSCIWDALPESVSEERRKKFEQVLRTGEPAEMEDCRNGMWNESVLYPVLDENNEVSAVTIFARDITARKLAEKALRDSEERFRSLAEMLPEVVFETDERLIITYANRKFSELSGYTKADLEKGISGFDMLDPEDWERARMLFLTRRNGREHGPLKYRARKKDGSTFPILFHAGFIYEGGKFAGLRGIAVDITHSKEAEERLRKTTRELQAAVKAGSIGLWDWDLITNKVQYSAEWKEQIGYEDHEIGNDFEEFEHRLHEDDIAYVMQSARGCIADRSRDFHVEFRFRHKNGSYRWIMGHGSVIVDDSGRPVRMVGSHVDITEQKLTEEALRDSEKRLKTAEKIGRIGHFEFDVESRSVYWSEFMYELFQRDPEDGPPAFEELLKMDYPDDGVLLEQCVRRAIEKAEPYEIDVRVRLPNGSTGYHHVIGNPTVENGKVTKIFGTVQDITEAKQVADMLRQTLEATTDGIWCRHVPTNTQTFSPRYYTMLGYRPGEFPASYQSWVELMHPDDRAKAVAESKECCRTKVDSFEREFRLRAKNGEYRWIRSKARIVERAPDGQALLLIGNHEDITERKEAERELRVSLEEAETSRREINSLLAASNAILQNQDFSATARIIFDSCKDLLGASAGYVALLNEDGTENDVLFLDSGGRKCVVDTSLPMPIRGLRAEAHKHRRAVYENDFFNSPWQRYIPEGHVKLDNVLFAPLIIDGKTVGIMGLANKEGGFNERDARNASAFGELSAIALKNSRDLELLSESEGRFRKVFENMSSAVAIYEAVGDGEDFVFKDINPAGARIGRMTLEEHRGKNVAELYPDVEEFGLFSVFQEVWRTGTPRHHPTSLYKDNRIELWMENYVCKLPSGELMAVYDDITEKRRTELALKESEEKANGIISSITDYMFIMDRNMIITWMNRPAVEVFGDHIGERCHEAFHNGQQFVCPVCAVDKTMHDGEVHDNEKEIIDSNGNVRWYWSTSGVVASDSSGRPSAVIEVVRDITDRRHAAKERKELQDQLNQSQKMESVGRLAGGVAHDFNNMLSVILGHAEMALEVTGTSHPIHEDLKEIYDAAGRSADLTRKLLAFARKQNIAPKILNLNSTIEGMLKMLRRLIGEDIDLVWKPDKELWDVKVDPVQIDQVLANLCVNSRDAIENVGEITIETRNAVFDIEYCSEHAGFLPGEYVMIAVSDNGSGMDKDTVDRIFEPFFTRKEQGKGTGLGLATVYGIVKQNDGFICVDSTPGTGTTFKICLPRFAAKTNRDKEDGREMENVHGRETILLVEDEEPILRMTAAILERLEYTVLPASTPGEAIRIARDHQGSIDLLMTDVIMPEMNGRDLAKNLLAYFPELKRLYISGYTADVIAHHGVLDEGVHFIQKPFSRDALAAKLRESIEGD